MERRFEEVELLIIYIDGMHFGDQCVLAAVGVDLQGRKHCGQDAVRFLLL